MYKLSPKDVCGAKFPSIYQLRKHRKVAKHQRKNQKTPVAHPDVSQYVTRVMEGIATETTDAVEEEDEADAVNSASEEEDKAEAGNSSSEEEDGADAGNSASEEEQIGCAEDTECCIMCGLTEDDDEVGLSARCALGGFTSLAFLLTIADLRLMTFFLCPECNVCGRVVKRRKLI